PHRLAGGRERWREPGRSAGSRRPARRTAAPSRPPPARTARTSRSAAKPARSGLVRLDGRLRTRLTPPPPRGESDEVPQWSADGRFIVFVRAGPTTKSTAARGRLYLVETTGR